MSVKKSIMKTLPRSGHTAELTIRSDGERGNQVRVEIDIPIPFDYSEQTIKEYDSAVGTGKQGIWADRLNHRIDEHDVQERTSTSSGNATVHGCYIEFDYYSNSDIKRTVEEMLREFDETIILERRRNGKKDEPDEAAQKQVCQNITEEIEDIDMDW